MKEIKSSTYIIDNHNALKNLKQRLTEARDEFAHYIPTDHGLVVENSEEKVKLEKSLKRKSSMTKIRKSKFTSRVGVANEGKRFASNISVSENIGQMLLISSQVRFPYVTNIIQYQRFIRNKLHTTSMPDHTVPVTNTNQETKLNYTITSNIITQLPSIRFSTSLLRNGRHSLTYLDLLSLESARSRSQLEKIWKYDRRFRTGWLHNEIINSFLYMLTKKNRSTLYCGSAAALVVAGKKSFRKLWKNEDLFSKSFIFISFNPNKCHWILVVVNISERAIWFLDPLATDTHRTYTSVERGYRIGLSLMQMKFGLTDVKCYHAEQIINGNVFLYFF